MLFEVTINNKQEESMPLWDSVQRSLEKASQEAARIAKTQRLRSTIDRLSRQVNTQQTTIFNRTMDLFIAGQLTQSELLSLCQEMVQFQQQLNQAQLELKQLQSSQAQGQPNQYAPTTEAGSGPAPMPYPPTAEDQLQTGYAPPLPEYQSYLDSTQEGAVPPPPPGVEPLTVSAMETVMTTPADAAPAANKQFCLVCHAELPPNIAFCHSCGAPAQNANSSHSPTIRAGNREGIHTADQTSAPGVDTATQTVQQAQENEGV
jgi:hypothetical protein